MKKPVSILGLSVYVYGDKATQKGVTLMGRRHGRKRHIAVCQCTAKSVCYTTWNAAMSAVSRVPGAIRAYRGKCCGHYHITRSTEDEYAQRMAELQCTTAADYGTVDSGQGMETYHEAGNAGAEPRGGEGGSRAEAVERGASDPLASPTPASLARRLEARRRPRVA